jgi:hypothetical protein
MHTLPRQDHLTVGIATFPTAADELARGVLPEGQDVQDE